MSSLIVKYTGSLFSTCSADKNRGNAASCDVTSFKLEAAVEIFFLQLCRSTMPKWSERERGIIVEISKLAAMLARCQDKTDEVRNSRRILRRIARKNCSDSGKVDAGSRLFQNIHSHSHLLEAVKRECAYIHPHFTILHFRSENTFRSSANNDRVLQILRTSTG